MSIDQTVKDRLGRRLGELYADRADEALGGIIEAARRHGPAIEQLRKSAWDQSDVLLITYGDQVSTPGMTPLRALGQFLAEAGLSDLLGIVHLLPFFPYSSDDGFSVIDYRTVDPALGDWSDVEALGESYDLMFDLVLNHVSRRSRWFEQYAAGREPFVRYFIEVDPAADLSAVVRPRSLPLLTPVETARGTRHLWTTFSDDQLDLNFAEPQLLVEMIDILLLYVAHGARIIRLDAIAYLWKQIGTTCIHLPQTHTVIKLMRELLGAVAPGTILLTETNVPQEENFSYFGDDYSGGGDEAQMVYQFSLAPLLLEALLSGESDLLVDWLAAQRATPPGTTVLNFTASHDGVGVRPLEGIMPAERFQRLIDDVKARGGHVSTRRNSDGSDSPYELNISYFSALAETHDGPHAQLLQEQRFLASQALMLSLRGIPGIYFHSLVGTPNDTAGVERSGRARSINRRKFQLEELQTLLASPDSPPARVLAAYRRLLEVRIAQPAFHPEAAQQVVRLPGDARSLVALLRTSLDGRQKILVLANFGRRRQTVELPPAALPARPIDLLSDQAAEGTITLAPYQVAWLAGV